MRLAKAMSGLVGLGLVVVGCAAGSGPKGTAGPVEWEVVDVGRVDSLDGMRSRWSFAIVLREKAGSAVQFRSVQRGMYGAAVSTAGSAGRPFDRRLEANGELRYSTSEVWGWPQAAAAGRQFGGAATLPSVTVELRFVGADGQGKPVAVPVRLVLSRGFGRPSRPVRSLEGGLPPGKEVQPDGLRRLAGRWEGYYRTGDFLVPLEAVTREDGSIEVGENDPVTNRFRGSLSVREGRLSYVGRDVGSLGLYEGEGRRILAGPITIATAGGGAATLQVRLEAVAPGTGDARSPGSTPVSGRPPVSRPALTSLTGTYRGTVAGSNVRGPFSLDFVLTLAQTGDEVTGTWAAPRGGSGMITGKVTGVQRVEFRMRELPPCAGEFSGAATIGEAGRTLGGTYEGTGCSGSVKATFTVNRQ